MKKAVNRFWDWMFHPSIRWYKAPNPKAVMYRYPAPGSRVNIPQYHDYRAPFETSHYNVRHLKQNPKQAQPFSSQFIADAGNGNIQQKLIAAKMLKKQQVSNPQAVAEAKQRYLKKFGVSVQTTVYKNDFDYDVVRTPDRQAMRQAIQKSFLAAKQSQFQNYAQQRQRTINNPDVMQFQSLDLYSHPHFQQHRIQNEYAIEQIMKQREKNGSICLTKGQKRFWKALDDSNDPHNIEKVQKQIGDSQPNQYELRKRKAVFVKDSNGQIIDIKYQN